MKPLPILLLVLMAAAFAVGLARLFDLRFAAGDIYPPCSSLRADPLGAKALYEGLGRLRDVRRNYRPRLPAGAGAGTTLLLLGIDEAEARYSLEDFKELEDFAAAGGRAVLSLQPSFRESSWFPLEPKASKRATNNPATTPGKKRARPPRRQREDTGDVPAESRSFTLAERWKFEIKRGVALQNARGIYEPILAKRKADAPLPDNLEWHTALWFDKPDPAWRVICAREKDRALVMERNFGGGSLVLLSDSFYFSNEALRWKNQPALLAWVVGSSQEIIFDETHLGVQEEPGVATLARKYRLHGLLGALLGLAGLYIWKNSVSFLPPHPSRGLAGDQDGVVGRESSAGFVNLLRRNIRPSAVLGVCLAEWKKTCGRGIPAAKLQQAEAVAQEERARPVEAYREMSRILARRVSGRIE
jgi:hypothetical protein